MNSVLKIATKFKLDNYLKYFIENNSANNAPYHNLYHTFCVIENSYKIGVDEGLSYAELRLLLLAAMFHDFNHSQGKNTDKYNVQLARRKFMEISKESTEDNIEIIELILATEYPYVIPDEDLSPLQKIIRDADMMQAFEKNYMQQVVFGLLMEELNMSLDKALEAQLKFFKSLKFHTNFAKDASKSLLQSKIDGITNLKSLLNVTN
jgi:hypothetical protein